MKTSLTIIYITIILSQIYEIICPTYIERKNVISLIETQNKKVCMT
jgi:hypothetical protein